MALFGSKRQFSKSCGALDALLRHGVWVFIVAMCSENYEQAVGSIAELEFVYIA